MGCQLLSWWLLSYCGSHLYGLAEMEHWSFDNRLTSDPIYVEMFDEFEKKVHCDEHLDDQVGLLFQMVDQYGKECGQEWLGYFDIG